MNETLRKQMEEMAYAHAGMQSPSAEMRPYYERAYTEGFTACSEIMGKKFELIADYVQHLDSCIVWNVGNANCTCGLDDRLKKLGER